MGELLRMGHPMGRIGWPEGGGRMEDGSTFTEGLCRVTLRHPELTQEEQAQRMEEIRQAAAILLRAAAHRQTHGNGNKGEAQEGEL